MFDEIKGAFRRTRGIVNVTPVLTSSILDRVVTGQCFLKCECFQRTGSFKFRGAYNALCQLSQEQKQAGVITHSSGNHAQALALAGKLLRIKAVIAMPRNASPAKLAATKSYGAEIIVCGDRPTDREKAVVPLMKKRKYTFIHPSDNLDVIAGAGTAAYELMRKVKRPNYIFCPVGGGGLLSGTAIATKGLFPSTEVIGVEPKNADDAFRSFKERNLIKIENPTTIADGLRTSLGPNTFRIIKKHVDQIITVSEQEIVGAMQFLWERMKLVVEPSGAVALAGVLSNQIDLAHKRVGMIISGGNYDLTSFFEGIRLQVESADSAFAPI